MGNSVERLSGNVKVAHRLLTYLRDLPAFCCPQVTGAEYAEGGIGSLGFTCAFDRVTGRLESYAALVPASANKLMWLATFVSGLDFLSRQVPMTRIDAVSLCCVLLFVNNLEPCVSLLRSGRMESAWSSKAPSPGGALALLLLELDARNAGVSRGKSGSIRFQAFSAAWETTSLVALDRVVTAMKIRCDKSGATDYSSATDADIQTANALAMKDLARAFSGAVTGSNRTSTPKKSTSKPGLIHQHVVHALAACGLLHPLRLLEHADISDKNSNAKKLGYEGSFNILKENVALWFQHELPMVTCTPALLENMVCEAHRAKVPRDLFFPGQFLLRLDVATGGQRYLTRLQPCWNGDGSCSTIESEYLGPRLTTAPQSFELQHQMPAIPLNDRTGSVGRIEYRLFEPSDLSAENWTVMKRGLFGVQPPRDVIRQVDGLAGICLQKKRSQNGVTVPGYVVPELSSSKKIWAPFVQMRERIELAFPDLLWDGYAMPRQAAIMDPLPLHQQDVLPELEQAADILLQQEAGPPLLPPPPRAQPLPPRVPPLLTNKEQGGSLPLVPLAQPPAHQIPPLPPLRPQNRVYSDWSAANLPTGSRLVESEMCNRRLYESTPELHRIQDVQFGPFRGAKDLLTSFCCSVQSSLKDQAFLALNSAPGRREPVRHTKNSRWYTMQEHPWQKGYTAEYVRTICPHRFSQVNACQLCDAIAVCFQGSKVEAQVDGSTALVWSFRDQGTATAFIYAATIATCGTSRYYQNLLRKFRSKYSHRVKVMEQMTRSGSPRKDARIPPKRDDGFFMYVWRRKDGVCPDMCLVGRTYVEGKDSQCVHDFSLAFPDHSFWDQLHSGQKAKGPGNAVYVRPLPQD